MPDEAKNVEILQEIYRLWHETRGKSVEEFLSILDDGISFGSLPQGAEPMRFAKPYNNRNLLREYFNSLSEQWSMNYYTIDQYVAQGDMVVARGKCSWNHRATGKTCNTPIVNFWRFRNGRAVEFFEYFDTAAAFAAATPDP